MRDGRTIWTIFLGAFSTGLDTMSISLFKKGRYGQRPVGRGLGDLYIEDNTVLPEGRELQQTMFFNCCSYVFGVPRGATLHFRRHGTNNFLLVSADPYYNFGRRVLLFSVGYFSFRINSQPWLSDVGAQYKNTPNRRFSRPATNLYSTSFNFCQSSNVSFFERSVAECLDKWLFFMIVCMAFCDD